MLDSCRALEGEGFEVTYLPVKTNGLIDLKVLCVIFPYQQVIYRIKAFDTIYLFEIQ